MEQARERHQLVIALGEGQDGKNVRDLLDGAAAAAGKPVSVWARELLLREVDASPEDPIVDVRLNGSEVTQVSLTAVDAMQGGNSIKVRAAMRGVWVDLYSNKPDELIARWKRVQRAQFR